MKIIKKIKPNKKVANRCPDCNKPVNLIEMFYVCNSCGCSGYSLLDVERWNYSVQFK